MKNDMDPKLIQAAAEKALSKLASEDLPDISSLQLVLQFGEEVLDLGSDTDEEATDDEEASSDEEAKDPMDHPTSKPRPSGKFVSKR